MSLVRNMSGKLPGYALRPDSTLSILEGLYPSFFGLADPDASIREKKLRRDHFDLSEAVHEAEFAHLQRPIDPATQEALEPDHHFTVTLESDGFTEEKWVPSSSDSRN